MYRLHVINGQLVTSVTVLFLKAVIFNVTRVTICVMVLASIHILDSKTSFFNVFF